MLPAKLQPYAKSVVPFVLTLIAIAVQWLVTGEYDRAELTTTLTGLSTTLVTFLVPNHKTAASLDGERGATVVDALLVVFLAVVILIVLSRLA